MTHANTDTAAVDLTSRFAKVEDRLRLATARFQRPEDAVRLLAVSKRHSSDAIRTLHAAGQECFGENYVDEALAKMTELADLPIEWHYIGPIQSNKTRLLAAHFSWVQSVDRLKLLRRLGTQRPTELPPLNILLQIHIGGEDTKAGAAASELGELAEAAESFPTLRLRGLMCIPPPETDVGRQRAWFRQLRELHERHDGPARGWDTLSMGMSADLEAAIAEGATMVRIGTDIFGPRS